MFVFLTHIALIVDAMTKTRYKYFDNGLIKIFEKKSFRIAKLIVITATAIIKSALFFSPTFYKLSAYSLFAV